MTHQPNIFAKARLNPGQWRAVAERRFGDAECLLASRDNERANGVIYMAGFAVECLLKALLVERHPNLGKPVDPAKLSSSDREVFEALYSHDLDDMLGFLPEFEKKLNGIKTAVGQDAWKALNDICEEWAVFVRYSPSTAKINHARLYLDAVKEVKKMAERTLTEPAYVSRLAAALQEALADAEIGHEQVRGDRYRFTVVSERFKDMGHPERQRIVWDIADNTLQKPDLLNVAMIMTIAHSDYPDTTIIV